LNQWTNAVRWEFKQTVPFLRSREFLWQEGHTAFATYDEAAKEVLQILDIYRRTFEEILAIPVVTGKKTEEEKFAGGFYTTTCEAFIPQNGRGIQGATSHCLGQNFSKLFNIKFEDENGEKSFAWQNSWGITTRTIGIMTMIHGDDKGLILPPKVAPIQVVLVPIYTKDTPNVDEIFKKAAELVAALNDANIRTHFDDRKGYTPGFKYNHWEMKGVPIRIELGPRDLENNKVVLVRRDFSEGDDQIIKKEAVDIKNMIHSVHELLDKIQKRLFDTAKKHLDDRTVKVTKWADFVPTLDKNCIVLAPWCDETECELEVKAKSSKAEEAEEKEEEVKKLEVFEKEALEKKTVKEIKAILVKLGAPVKGRKPELIERVLEKQKEREASGGIPDEAVEAKGFGLKAAAKTLCKPFNAPHLEEDAVCFACGKKAKAWTLFGRSY